MTHLITSREILIFTITVREMISEHNSAASTLRRIIDRIEVGSETVNEPINWTPRERDISKPVEKSRKMSKVSISSEVSTSRESLCRICYDSNNRFPIIYPCKCKGTIGAIHLTCLERWLEESNRNSCELCGQEFQVQRTPRYRALQSIMVWFCLSQEQHQLFVRSLRIDLLRCAIVTPMTIMCSYVCVVAADFYSMNNYDNFPPARWTTYSLLAMMILLIFSYFVWLYMAIQYHQKVWFYWWQKTSMVKVILPAEKKSSTSHKSVVSQV